MISINIFHSDMFLILLENVLSLGNRKEFHHIFPKAYLEKLDSNFTSNQINCLANFSILSRTDNNKIKDNAPSKYRADMPAEGQERKRILKTHLCPIEMFEDDYEKFLSLRADLLLEKAKKLAAL